jgi:hypothetical protein
MRSKRGCFDRTFGGIVERKNRANYPWDLWLAGGEHKAIHGVDYYCMPNSFAQGLRNKAYKDGYKVEVTFDDPTTVRFEFTKNEESDPSNS